MDKPLQELIDPITGAPVTLPPETVAPQGAATVTIPIGSRVYVTQQGDFWDLIAIRVYGFKRGNEHLMYRLLEENYPLREVVEFSAGIPVIVPPVDTSAVIPLVPWKSTEILPS